MMNEMLTLSADSVTTSFENDPELAIPEYPRLAPEIIALPFGQAGLLFEGGHTTQVVSGRSARGVVLKMIPHLDGTRTVEDVCALVPGLTPDAARKVVTLLYSRGLLESGASPAPPRGLMDLDAFAGRYADVTRINRNRGEALARLATAHVTVGGSGQLARLVYAALAESGIGTVERIEEPSELAQTDLLVAAFAGDDAGGVQAWLDAAWARGTYVLHAHIASDAVEIGPLFVPHRSACYGCLRTLFPAPSGGAADDAGYWAGLVALQAFHVAGHIGNPRLYNMSNVHRRETYGNVHEARYVVRLPGCATCGLEGRGPASQAGVASVWHLHESTTLPPLEFQNPRDHQHHYAAANMQITADIAEPYYGALRVALPPALGLDVAPAWISGLARADRVPSLEDLATVLRYAVGYEFVADEYMHRIAPSGGGLGSAEMFVVARGVSGLDDGVYHYYSPHHVLERLIETPDQLLAGALGIAKRDLPRLLLVGTASHMKLRHKYGNFAFRFSNLDAGIALQYAREVTGALGLSCVEYPDLRDQALAHAVKLPVAGNRNVVTYALGVGGSFAPYAKPFMLTQVVDTLVERVSTSARTPRDAAQQPPDLLGAPESALASDDLGAVLRARRSVREFAEAPVPTHLLRAMLGSAVSACRAREASGGLPLRHTLWLAVNRGDDVLSSGIYRYDAPARAFERVRDGLEPGMLTSAMLQPSLSRAPAILLITGDFEQALTAHGAVGYRELIARAGTIAARTLVTAQAFGINGCPWGGFMEDAWGPLLGIDRYRDCPLFGVSLGYKA